MPDYEVPQSVIEASLAELAEIYRWVHDRESVENPVTILLLMGAGFLTPLKAGGNHPEQRDGDRRAGGFLLPGFFYPHALLAGVNRKKR